MSQLLNLGSRVHDGYNWRASVRDTIKGTVSVYKAKNRNLDAPIS